MYNQKAQFSIADLASAEVYYLYVRKLLTSLIKSSHKDNFKALIDTLKKIKGLDAKLPVHQHVLKYFEEKMETANSQSSFFCAVICWFMTQGTENAEQHSKNISEKLQVMALANFSNEKRTKYFIAAYQLAKLVEGSNPIKDLIEEAYKISQYAQDHFELFVEEPEWDILKNKTLGMRDKLNPNNPYHLVETEQADDEISYSVKDGKNVLLQTIAIIQRRLLEICSSIDPELLQHFDDLRATYSSLGASDFERIFLRDPAAIHKNRIPSFSETVLVRLITQILLHHIIAMTQAEVINKQEITFDTSRSIWRIDSLVSRLMQIKGDTTKLFMFIERLAEQLEKDHARGEGSHIEIKLIRKTIQYADRKIRGTSIYEKLLQQLIKICSVLTAKKLAEHEEQKQKSANTEPDAFATKRLEELEK